MTPRIVKIREAECIGCTKCIQACPVDAIVGATQLMHTVITDHCIGCDLCIPPCPVDCIDVIEISDTQSRDEKKQQANLAKQRVQARKTRLNIISQEKETERQQRIAAFNASPQTNDLIKQAMERAAQARSGRTDKERAKSALQKLTTKLEKMETELSLLKEKGESNPELERRIITWSQKISDEKKSLDKD